MPSVRNKNLTNGTQENSIDKSVKSKRRENTYFLYIHRYGRLMDGHQPSKLFCIGSNPIRGIFYTLN